MENNFTEVMNYFAFISLGLSIFFTIWAIVEYIKLLRQPKSDDREITL